MFIEAEFLSTPPRKRGSDRDTGFLSFLRESTDTLVFSLLTFVDVDCSEGSSSSFSDSVSFSDVNKISFSTFLTICSLILSLPAREPSSPSSLVHSASFPSPECLGFQEHPLTACSSSS